MTKSVEKIVNTAARFNACNIVSEIKDMNSAIATLLTPQGREFAMRTGYPSFAAFRENVAELSRIPGVFIDAGKCVCSIYDTVSVGDTFLTVMAFGVERIYHVMAMHGARVRIDARNHAVITATSIGGYFEFINDGSAIINIEK